MCYFVLYAIKYNASRIYVINIDPIIWGDDINEARKFPNYSSVTHYVKSNFTTYKYFRDMLQTSSIVRVNALLLEDGVEKEDIQIL